MATLFLYTSKSHHTNKPSRINGPVTPLLSACLTAPKSGDYSLVLGGNKDIAKNGSKSRVSATNICGVLGSLRITNEHLMIGSSDQDASEWNTLKGRKSSRVHDFPMISLFRTAQWYVRMSTNFLIMTFSPGYQLHWKWRRPALLQAIPKKRQPRYSPICILELKIKQEIDLTPMNHAFSQSFLNEGFVDYKSYISHMYNFMSHMYLIIFSIYISIQNGSHVLRTSTPRSAEVHQSSGPLQAMSVSTRCHGFCTIFGGCTMIIYINNCNYMYIIKYINVFSVFQCV